MQPFDNNVDKAFIITFRSYGLLQWFVNMKSVTMTTENPIRTSKAPLVNIVSLLLLSTTKKIVTS